MIKLLDINGNSVSAFVIDMFLGSMQKEEKKSSKNVLKIFDEVTLTPHKKYGELYDQAVAYRWSSRRRGSCGNCGRRQIRKIRIRDSV